ncbi:MAG: glycosyltransferase family 2 protein [Treponemataceae bacterium]|nr:glycosyltransferase family 2 protein [Treponemataceae bacterium]
MSTPSHHITTAHCVKNTTDGKTNNTIPSLAIVVPCYNEEEVLPVTAPIFLAELETLRQKKLVSAQSKILFVDDGSSDSTWEIIKKLSKKNPDFLGIRQSRNRGHQNAVLAGLMEAKENFDITISIDCDGQDDVSAMDKMCAEYQKGNEIVYGVRSQRKKDSFFKRFTAESFYKLLGAMGAEVVFNHADYRLVSARVLNEFENFGEVNLFLRGMFPLVGFKSSEVFYERNERVAGKSHYPLAKMLHLAFDGITSLSVKPIRIITSLGILVSLVSFIGVVWSLAVRLSGHSVDGWASMVCILCFVSGVQMVSLGIIGEYIGKIYLETKRRPRFIISERTWEENETFFKKN